MNSDDVPFNYGDWYGIDVFGGYVTSLPASLVHLGHDAYKVRMLYGTKYWIGRGPRDADQVKVFSGTSGINVYESPGAFPRVWTIHRAVTVPSQAQVPTTFDESRFDARQTALFVREAPKLEQCGGADNVSLSHDGFDTAVIDVRMQCAGLVVLSDNDFPGWSASVDGRPARIWSVDTVIRGVRVGAGVHRVEMQYHSRPFLAGVTLLGMSLTGLLGLWWFERKKSGSVPSVA